MQKIITSQSIISPNYERKTGKDVWHENLRLAVFAADKIRSTLGPKGAYKLVTYNRGPEQVIKVTKDAIAILDELAILYPPAVIVAEAAKMQRQEAGDGVATFVVFLSALLKKADEMVTQKIHPNVIIHGFHLATEKALQTLDSQAIASKEVDVLGTVDCGRNLLTPKVRDMIRDAYPLAFCEGKFDIENTGFLRKNGGCIEDSTLIRGVVIKKEKAHPNMPDRLSDLRVAIVSERLGFDRLEIKMRGEGPIPIKLNVKSAGQIGKYKETEIRLKTQCIHKLSDLKVNVLLCEQPLEDYQKTLLASKGIFTLEKVDKKDTQAVAKASGAKIAAKLQDLGDSDVGTAKELFTGRIELEKTVTFQGCKGATFLLRGNIPQAIDELETAIKNSLTALKITADDGRFLPGGGAAEAHVAQELKDYAKAYPSKEQLAIDGFAVALMDIPRCLAENCGLNPTDTLLELKKHHANAAQTMGVGEHGCGEWVCFEPIKVKRSAIRRAYEVASLMLRIDELLISKEIPKFHKK